MQNSLFVQLRRVYFGDFFSFRIFKEIVLEEEVIVFRVFKLYLLGYLCYNIKCCFVNYFYIEVSDFGLFRFFFVMFRNQKGGGIKWLSEQVDEWIVGRYQDGQMSI